jgi:hypothetical protein
MAGEEAREMRTLNPDNTCPTVDEYRAAAAAIRGELTLNQLHLLQRHYHARRHRATARQLAKQVGFANQPRRQSPVRLARQPPVPGAWLEDQLLPFPRSLSSGNKSPGQHPGFRSDVDEVNHRQIDMIEHVFRAPNRNTVKENDRVTLF